MTIEVLPERKPKSAPAIMQLLRDITADACEQEVEYIEITRKIAGKVSTIIATRKGVLPKK